MVLGAGSRSRRPVRGALAALVMITATLATTSGCIDGRGLASSSGGGYEGASLVRSITFETASPLRLEPGERVSLSVVTAGVSRVRFSLEGSYGDAYLAEAEATARDGHAEVELRAPTAPAAFAVRARAEGAPDAVLRVSVSAHGYGTLELYTTYSGGRDASSVMGNVLVGARCAELPALFEDGQVPAFSGPLRERIVLDDVPAGEPLAVVAQVARYAWGCLDVPALERSEMRPLTVPVFDLPLTLAGVEYTAALRFVPEAAATSVWQALLDGGRAAASAAFVPSGTTEGAALLAAMRALTPNADLAAFDAASKAQRWPKTVDAWMASLPAPLSTKLEGYAQAGDDGLTGTLALTIRGAAPREEAEVSVASLGAASDTTGLRAEAPFLWMADARDTLLLRGALVLPPSSLAITAADVAARKAMGVSVSDALAGYVDCSALGSKLGAFGACTAGCTAKLCAAAVDAMVSRAEQASTAAGDVARLQVAASAPAVLESSTTPSRFAGAWVGDLTSRFGSFSLSGNAEGQRR